jgi:hypothetical protein
MAFWAATAAGLSSLAAVEVAQLLTDTHVFRQALGAFITAAVVGGSVYAHERLTEEREHSGTRSGIRRPMETPQPGAPPTEPTPEPEPAPGNGDEDQQ